MAHRIIAPLLTLLFLGACSSSPKELNSELEVDKVVQPMNRNMIIDAVGECQGNDLRAVMVYSKRKINGYSSEVVVDVYCAPRYKLF